MIVPLIRKRWFVVSFVVLFFLIVVLVATPFLIRHLAKNWLLENGGDQVQFRDVDFNPFTATLLLKSLDVRVDNETTLSFDSAGLDLAWRPLLKKQVNVQSVQLNGLRLVVDNRDALKLGGITLAGAAEAEQTPQEDTEQASGWLAGIETLTLTDIQVQYRDSDIESNVVLERAQLTGLAQWAPEQPAHIELAGTVNGARLSLSADLAPLAEQPLYQGNLSLADFPLAPLAPLTRPALESLEGRLTLKSDFSVQLSSGAVQVAHDGKLSVADLKVAATAANVDVASAQLDGNTDVRLGGSDKSMTIAAEGGLDVGPVAATVQQPDLQVANKRLALKGKVAFKQGAGQSAVQLDSDIDLEALSVATDQSNTQLIDLQALSIDDLQVENTDNIRAAAIDAKVLVVGRDADTTADPQAPAALVQIAHTAIKQPSFVDRVVAVETLQHEGVQVRIHRDSKGELTLTQLIDSVAKLGKTPGAEATAAPEQPPEDTAQEAVSAETVAIAIERIEIGGNSSISITDESVEPAFSTELLLQEVRLEQLDSRQATQASPLLIDGKIGKHSSLSLKGTVKPFLKPPGMDLQGNITALDLPQLSSYTKGSLGVLLNSGTLDSELSLKTEAESLEGLATLKLNQLELTGTAGKNSLQSRLPVPLNVALDTLRDKQNSIQLKIPVEGNVNDPKFSINDAINQALAKGLQKGAFSYLKHALQPYGTLISVAQYAGEQMSKVRLNPVEFAPGEFTLDAGDREYLQKVAQVLKDRPKIAIKLCGVAVQQDQVVLQQQLQARQPPQSAAPAAGAAPAQAPPQAITVDPERFNELAQQRADAVKDHLVEQHGIPASHLVGCLPQLELEQEKAAPRTDLLI